jgi:hypothetical protein
MSIPLDRLYHYIESVARDVYGDTIIYRFYPHGSKKLEDLSLLSPCMDWKVLKITPQIVCNDQEPLNYEFYQPASILTDAEYFLKHRDGPSNNIRRNCFTIYDKCILIHSELNSSEVLKYQSNGFIPVYYWSHAIIALDWFRYAQYQSQSKNIKKKFLIYNRAWSGTREYRLKFLDLLIKHNLISNCQTSCNSVEPELQIHYTQHQYINPQWKPDYRLENYVDPTSVTSCSSADFNLNDYGQTEFEVVLETLFDDCRIQLTEKILRPIACGQPFLILGTANSLKYLHRYGFKTFSDIIDESYDNIVDAQDRMQAVVNVMSTIANWTSKERTVNMSKIKEITEHNRRYFFSNDFFNLITNELKQNLESGLSELEKTNTGNKFLSLRKNLSMNSKCREILIQKTSYRTRVDIAQVVKTARNYYNR